MCIEDDQRDGRPHLWGKTGRAGAAQIGEEAASGRAYITFQYLNRVYKKDGDKLWAGPIVIGQEVIVLSQYRVDLV